MRSNEFSVCLTVKRFVMKNIINENKNNKINTNKIKTGRVAKHVHVKSFPIDVDLRREETR